MKIEFFDCHHCNTNGVLPMEGMICPNCKKTLFFEHRQEKDVLDKDSVSSKSTNTAVSNGRKDTHKKDEVSYREHLHQQSDVTTGVGNKPDIQADEKAPKKRKHVELKAIKPQTTLDFVMQVSLISGAGLFILSLVMILAGQTGTRPALTIREYEKAPKARLRNGYGPEAADKRSEVTNYINLLQQWSKVRPPKMPLSSDVQFKVDLKYETPKAVLKQIHSLEQELDRFNLLYKQGSENSYIVKLKTEAFVYPGQTPPIIYRSKWWEDMADRGSIMMYLGFILICIGCLLMRHQRTKRAKQHSES